MSEEYTCAMCGETFEFVNDETWNNEKAVEEMVRNFGNLAPEEPLSVVCDNCFQKLPIGQ